MAGFNDITKPLMRQAQQRSRVIDSDCVAGTISREFPIETCETHIERQSLAASLLTKLASLLEEVFGVGLASIKGEHQ